MTLKFISVLMPAMNAPGAVQSERLSSLAYDSQSAEIAAGYGATAARHCLEVIGNLPHCARIMPATRADRDALVKFLRAIPYAEPLPKPGAPNLDHMTDEDLEGFAVRYERGARAPLTHARAMFPGAKRGHVNALRSLAHYARNVLTARQCRTRGDIQAAQIYETIADGIYNRLPAFARW